MEAVMKEAAPKVSVIIPVYNGQAYLAEAIASVCAQDRKPWEIIIVDDGSTDESAMIAGRFSLARYCRQPHAGLGAALNRGIREAVGDCLGFLDADDLWAPEKLSIQTAALANDPGLDMVFGHVEPFISPELGGEAKGKEAGRLGPMPGTSKGTMLVRRDSLFRVGWFSSQWRVGDFVDWYARALERGLRSAMLPDVVLLRRLHCGNMGLWAGEARRDYVRILKSALDRRRQKSDGKRQ